MKFYNALNVEIPKRFAQLEQWVAPDRYLVADRFSIADITLASILINFSYGGKGVDEKAYPKLHGYFAFVLQNPSIRDALNAEQEAARTVPGLDFRFLQGVL